MDYKYGCVTNNQINSHAKSMHSEIHKLLLYKDSNITDRIFDSDAMFLTYFDNMLLRFGGMNELIGNPPLMLSLMSTLQAARAECESSEFRFGVFRKLIFDAHGYLTQIFGEVR